LSPAQDFWSRRRAAVMAEEQAEQTARIEAERAAEEAALAERSDEELLAEAGLKEPEQLDTADEVRDFLASGLPQRLKTRALRRLWRLNPVLANVDGLVDYGEDFTDAATVVENLTTVYQVGKGMFDKAVAEAERAAALAEAAEEQARAADDTAPAEPDTEEDTDVQAQAALAAAAADSGAAASALHGPAETAPDTLAAPRARRMRFAFDQS